jgi:hypothetical protein
LVATVKYLVATVKYLVATAIWVAGLLHTWFNLLRNL